MDILTKEQRSLNMSRIRSRNTKPEIKLRKLLVSEGFIGYRVNYSLLGRPDVVFTKKRLAVFIDGCFWHKCDRCFIKPETRTKFWVGKINNNVMRDQQVSRKLEEQGWTVLRFWEHQLRKEPENIISEIGRNLRQVV